MADKAKNIKVIIAGGGTGGHIFPGLAIAAALKKQWPAIDILFVGAKGKMEMQRVPEAGFDIKGIDIAGLNRSSVLKNLKLPFMLLKSYFEVKKIIRDFKPDAAIGVGGYSSFPLLKAAQLKGIPTFIHESNSLAGKSNKILGKKAKMIFVSSEGMEKYFDASKIKISGNPVRSNILQPASKEEARRFFGFGIEHKTVLSVGGSLGARSINNAVAEQIEWFKEQHIQLIWQTGKSFEPDSGMKKKLESPFIWIHPFIQKMDLAYRAADLVIARAGAMTISELKALGKAAILIPYPFAAEDHQTVNAKVMEENGAAILVKDDEVNEKLIPTVQELLGDEARLEKMNTASRKMGIVNADEVIAKEILNVIKNEKNIE